MRIKQIIKLILSFIIILSIGLYAIQSIAMTPEYQIKLTSNKAQVEKGANVEITLSIESESQQGIAAYYSKIEYDSDKLEIIDVNGIGNWDVPLINNNEIIATTRDGEYQFGNQDVAVIIFKAKEDIINQQGTIKMSEFQVSNTEEIETTNEQKVILGENETVNTPNSDSDNNSNDNSNSSIKDDTMSNLKLPYTGTVAKFGFIILTIVIFTLISITIMRHKKSKKA